MELLVFPPRSGSSSSCMTCSPQTRGLGQNRNVSTSLEEFLSRALMPPQPQSVSNATTCCEDWRCHPDNHLSSPLWDTTWRVCLSTPRSARDADLWSHPRCLSP
ncbi:ATP-dependent RNA helicase DHX29 [Lates japonicus]|uniref:ATP-dependent RNA helicase DHX29 n=1 Tax=Lates japonicus TaxID=270547 RepID=A0AAD3MBY8_LATJO|nr:ATP-dependent RNA helicase DHX29 [Lates japonicus]